MSSRYRQLIKDTFIFGLGNLGSKLILFLMVPLYTNFMSEAEYGTSDLVFTIAQLITPFLSVVIFDSVIRFGLSKREKKEDVLLVGVVILVFSIIAGLAIVPLIKQYGTVAKWSWYLYIYIIASIANNIEFNYLKAKGKNKTFALLSVVQTGLMAGLNIVFLVSWHMGVQGYLSAYIASVLISDICLVFAADIVHDLKQACFDLDLFKRMVFYSSPLILNNISWWAIQSSDKVMVEIMISTSALGIYTAAAKIPALINVMVSIFQQAWGISAVREYESTNDYTYYSEVFKYLFLFVSGSCIAFVSIMKIFMNYYVGAEFQEAWHYVPLLLVSAVFAAVASYFGSMYGALKKSINNMFTTACAAITNVLANWILIPLIGIWGAVIGTLLAYIIIAMLRLLDVKRMIKLEIDWVTLSLNVLILLIQASLVAKDYHVYFVSLASIIAFIVINAKDIVVIIKRIKHMLLKDGN